MFPTVALPLTLLRTAEGSQEHYLGVIGYWTKAVYACTQRKPSPGKQRGKLTLGCCRLALGNTLLALVSSTTKSFFKEVESHSILKWGRAVSALSTLHSSTFDPPAAIAVVPTIWKAVTAQAVPPCGIEVCTGARCRRSSLAELAGNASLLPRINAACRLWRAIHAYGAHEGACSTVRPQHPLTHTLSYAVPVGPVVCDVPPSVTATPLAGRVRRHRRLALLIHRWPPYPQTRTGRRRGGGGALALTTISSSLRRTSLPPPPCSPSPTRPARRPALAPGCAVFLGGRQL